MIRNRKGAAAASDIIGPPRGRTAPEDRRPHRKATGQRPAVRIRFTDRKWPRPARVALIVIVSLLLWSIMLMAAGIL